MQNIGELKTQIHAIVAECENTNEPYTRAAEELITSYECSDNGARDRIRRLSGYCGLIAEKQGVEKEDIKYIKLAAIFHNIGMATVPEEFFKTPHSLTVYQYAVVKTHTTTGGTLLSGQSKNSFRHIRESALFHHEAFDGSGYPIGLKGKQIPLFARIISLLDTFDILTSQRPHKVPYPFDLASDIIYSERKKYDPDILSLFSDNLGALIKIKYEIEGELRFVCSKADCELSERDKMRFRSLGESSKN
jgi:putative two-component system response regulator